MPSPAAIHRCVRATRWRCSRPLRAAEAMPVRVQHADFDIAREVAALRGEDGRVGAVALFVGTVRDQNDAHAVSTLTLEHYPGMTEKALQAIVDEAKDRWPLYDVLVIHRVGELQPRDQIVLVAVTSAHRGDAF